MSDLSNREAPCEHNQYKQDMKHDDKQDQQYQSPEHIKSPLAHEAWSPSSCSTVVDYATPQLATTDLPKPALSLQTLFDPTTQLFSPVIEPSHSTNRTPFSPFQPLSETSPDHTHQSQCIPTPPIATLEEIFLVDNYIRPGHIQYPPMNRLYRCFRPRIPKAFTGAPDTTLPKANDIQHAILIRNALTQFHLAVLLADEHVLACEAKNEFLTSGLSQSEITTLTAMMLTVSVEPFLDNICEEYMPSMVFLGITDMNIFFYYYGRMQDRLGEAVKRALERWRRKREMEKRMEGAGEDREKIVKWQEFGRDERERRERESREKEMCEAFAGDDRVVQEESSEMSSVTGPGVRSSHCETKEKDSPAKTVKNSWIEADKDLIDSPKSPRKQSDEVNGPEKTADRSSPVKMKSPNKLKSPKKKKPGDKTGKFRDAKAWAADDAAEEERRASSESGSMKENDSAYGSMKKTAKSGKQDCKDMTRTLSSPMLSEEEWPSLGWRSS